MRPPRRRRATSARPSRGRERHRLARMRRALEPGRLAASSALARPSAAPRQAVQSSGAPTSARSASATSSPARAVDHDAALGLARRDRQVGLAQRLVKVESPRASNRSAPAASPRRAPTRARPTSAGRSRMRVRSGCVSPTTTRSSASISSRRRRAGDALVDAGRIRRSGRRSPMRRAERRPDGVVADDRLARGANRRPRPEAPSGLAAPDSRTSRIASAPRRAARLAREHARRCHARRRRRGQTRDLRRLAGPLAAFEGDEPSAHHACASMTRISAGAATNSRSRSSRQPVERALAADCRRATSSLAIKRHVRDAMPRRAVTSQHADLAGLR